MEFRVGIARVVRGDTEVTPIGGMSGIERISRPKAGMFGSFRISFTLSGMARLLCFKARQESSSSTVVAQRTVKSDSQGEIEAKRKAV
jgi:hypothetical protein